MKLRNHDPNETPRWSPDELRAAFLFWLLWSVYVAIAAIIIVSLFTDWPHFLHEQSYFR